MGEASTAGSPPGGKAGGGAGQIDIRAILESGSLDSHYQPIVSTKDGKIVGVEALARPRVPGSGEFIPPIRFFAEAAAQGFALEADRLCRKRGIEGFAESFSDYPELLVFINLDAAILLRFVESHREEGFLIALDDMGTGSSNLERLTILKPDIVKLDHSLIRRIDGEYYKQELYDFFLKLTSKFGTMVIAEGVETREEALACMERGGDLMQGYYFAPPSEPGEALRECIRLYPDVECAYLLDGSGFQASSTVFNPSRSLQPGKSLFCPAQRGCDQRSKDYFLSIDAKRTRYFSAPYVSKASGRACITISTARLAGGDVEAILCLDISTPP